jgi:rhamnulokinase
MIQEAVTDLNFFGLDSGGPNGYIGLTMSAHRFLAFDLGAESGRAMLGGLENGRLSIVELRRFPNGPLTLFGRLHWNIYALFEEIQSGLRACAASLGGEPESLAVDTWGVDFGLLAEDGSLLGLPFAYRDPRNLAAMERFLGILPKERIYELTGIQFMPFNSLFQLHALMLENPALLRAASDLLFMPDLATHFLTGVRTTESTIASTSQLIDPRSGQWCEDLFDALGVSLGLMPKPIRSGTVIGTLRSELAEGSGLGEILVVDSASHDTASAVAAVPASGENWAYISSGTWSLMGIETQRPLITPRTLELNFTNEGGMEGTIRLLKNVTGLWLVQQCRKKWNAAKPASYDELVAAAESAHPFKAVVDPDDADFLNPADMPEAIREFCRKTKQSVPETPAEIVRCALESLALKYRSVLEELRQVSPNPIERIHIIGGGSRNTLLNQFTASATSAPVVAGPAEATAAGNIMGQALALGYVRSLEEIRAIVAASTEPRAFEPRETKPWDSAYERFREIIRGQRHD